jgi:hypothetical protein
MHNLQPSPLPDARRMGSPQSLASFNPSNPKDVDLFRSWLVYDSDFELTRTRGRINWNMVAGALLAVLVSAAGWAGIAVLVARLWKVG